MPSFELLVQNENISDVTLSASVETFKKKNLMSILIYSFKNDCRQENWHYLNGDNGIRPTESSCACGSPPA